MTVQELFNKLDKTDIVDAYLFLYGYNEERVEAAKRSIEENLFVIRRERKMSEQLVDFIRSCTPEKMNKEYILFAVPEKDTFYDRKGKPARVATYLVIPEEAKKIISAPDWDESKVYDIDSYSYDFSPTEEVVGCEVADTSMKHLDPLLITADILEELSFFGFDQTQRRKRIEEESRTLLESMEQIKRDDESDDCNGIKSDDFFAEIEQRILNACETDDEREYILLERDFDAKVEAIERRYADKIMEENKLVRAQYYTEEFGDAGSKKK